MNHTNAAAVLSVTDFWVIQKLHTVGILSEW